MRTGKEASTLKWGDIKLRSDTVHGEFLIYDTERQTKTRTGAEPRNIRTSKPKAWPTPDTPEKCPITLYKKYKAVRPTEMLDPDAPFFLTVANDKLKEGQAWYKRVAMGINKLYNIMKEMKVAAGIEAPNIKPYSARKRLLQNMNDQNIPPQHQVQISGHRNINSLNSYSEMNLEQSKLYSDIIVNGGKARSDRNNEYFTTASPVTNANDLVPAKSQYAESISIKTPGFESAQTSAQDNLPAPFNSAQYGQPVIRPTYFPHAHTPFQYHHPNTQYTQAQSGQFGILMPMALQPPFNNAHPPLITGNTFNGPVTFQLHNSQNHNQTAMSAICQQPSCGPGSCKPVTVNDNSPDIGQRRWKCIRSISNSDSDYND